MITFVLLAGLAQPASLVTHTASTADDDVIILVDPDEGDRTQTSADSDDAIILIDEGDWTQTSTGSDEIILIEPEVESESETSAPSIRARANARFDARFAMDTSFDRKGEQIAELALGARLELDVELSTRVAVYAAPSFTFVTALSREGDDREVLYLVPPEAWLSWASGPLVLRMGSMVFSWGSSDFVAPNDVLNPLDLRRGALAFDEASKIPVIAAELVAGFGPLTLRAVVEPFFTPSRFHLTGWDSAIIQPGAFPGAPTVSLDGLVSPAFLDELGDQAVVTERPRTRIDNATVAGRAQLRLGIFDLAATAVSGWDSLPRMTIDPNLALILGAFAEAQAAGAPPPFDSPEVVGALVRLQEAVEQGRTLFGGTYRRRNLVGFDASVALDPFVLKLDVAYTFSRSFYDTLFRPLDQPWINGVLGLEYYDGERLQIVAEAFVIGVLGVPAGRRLVLLEAADAPANTERNVFLPGMVSAIRYTMLDGELRFELGFAVTFTRGDFILLPRITWQLDDHHQVALGGAAVEGKNDGYGGVYTHTDQVFVAYRFTY